MDEDGGDGARRKPWRNAGGAARALASYGRTPVWRQALVSSPAHGALTERELYRQYVERVSWPLRLVLIAKAQERLDR